MGMSIGTDSPKNFRMNLSSPWKILSSKDQWIYKWDPSTNTILVSDLIYIWGKCYTDAEILDQTPTNFKCNSLNQIKDLLASLLSKSAFTPETSQDLILKGQLPISHFYFTWTFILARLDQTLFYHHLTLPLLQILKSSIAFIDDDSKFNANLDKSLKQKNQTCLFETSRIAGAFERLHAVPKVTTSPTVSKPQIPQQEQDYEANLKKSLSKKKRKSLFS